MATSKQVGPQRRSSTIRKSRFESDISAIDSTLARTGLQTDRDVGKHFVLHADERLKAFLKFGIGDLRTLGDPENNKTRRIKFDK